MMCRSRPVSGPRIGTVTVAGGLPRSREAGSVHATSLPQVRPDRPAAPATTTPPGGWVGRHDLSLARTGRAMVMVQRAAASGPSYPAPLPDLVATLRPPLEEMAGQVA